MKFPSIFKPLVRALSGRSSSRSSISRSSSVGSRASSLSSLDNFETMKAHLAWNGNVVAARMLDHAKARGLIFPKLRAKQWGRVAIHWETQRIQKLFAERGDAERGLIRARSFARDASLKLRQAERQHGAHSLIAHRARQVSLAASRAVGTASADLYMIHISL